MERQIAEYLDQYNFDVRKTKNSRFMDQKCTPDVICAVCECVVEYVKDNVSIQFTKNDIWKSEYANNLITESFSKPNLSKEDAKSEYDKFFSQPLKALSYAKILNEEKIGTTNYYNVRNAEILQYISLREKSALFFLDCFLTKTMEESGMIQSFNTFFQRQNSASLKDLCDGLLQLYRTNTAIKGDYEPPRIYNKIINILAFKRKAKGIVKGKVSKNTLTIDEIRYNRINWRDLNKDKTISRQAYNELFQQNIGDSKGYYKYYVQKAKKLVRQLHPYSEIHRFPEYPGLQAHHIFMESEFPEIADYPENIICTTPNQHFYRAHPNNRTSVVDSGYQLICLLCKLDTIEMDIRSGSNNYSLSDFVNVLNIGFDTSTFTMQMDYEEIKHRIVKNAIHL
ncbi:MAG: restriction endonuclease [Chitinispirillia bacterium]|nr:restriction endonuclease [Chitinispirillia bacterium]